MYYDNGVRTSKVSGCTPNHRAARLLVLLSSGVMLFLSAIKTSAGDATADLIMDLFLQKGMVTQEEAARIRAEAERIRTNMPPEQPFPAETKFTFGKGNKRIELFGDLRLRYES